MPLLNLSCQKAEESFIFAYLDEKAQSIPFFLQDVEEDILKCSLHHSEKP